MWSEERALWALEKRNGEKAWNIDFPCSNLKKATIVFQWKLLSVRRRSAAATVGDDEVRMYLTVWILSVLLLKETHLCFTTRSSEKIKLNKIRVYLSAFSVCVRRWCMSVPSFVCWSTASSESVKSEPSTSVSRKNWNKPNSTWCWSHTSGPLSVSVDLWHIREYKYVWERERAKEVRNCLEDYSEKNKSIMFKF